MEESLIRVDSISPRLRRTSQNVLLIQKFTIQKVAGTLKNFYMFQQTDRIEDKQNLTECGTKGPHSNRMSVIGEGIDIGDTL